MILEAVPALLRETPEQAPRHQPDITPLCRGPAAAPTMMPVAGALAGLLAVMAVQRVLRERSESQAKREYARDIDNASVATLLYIADGEKHATSDVAKALAMPYEELKPGIDALEENELVAFSREGSLESIALTPEGRDIIVRLSSEMAS